MTVFNYKAVTATGDSVEGSMEAPNKESVIARLNDLGYMPIRADARSLRSSLTADLSFSGRRRPSQNERVVLMRELATLIGARLPIDRAVEVIVQRSSSGPVRTVLGDVLDRLRRGSSLSDSMGAHPDVFSNADVSMVRAGEAGGTLELVLARVAEQTERLAAVRESVRAALIYPIILLLGVAVTLVVMFSFVLPQFQGLFEEAGAEMPMMAQLLIGSGDLFRRYGWAIPVLGMLAFFWVRVRLRRPAGRYKLHKLALRLPLAGELIRFTETARFSRTLATLLGNGVETLSALAIVKDTLSNVVMREGVEAVVAGLKKGQLIAGPLTEQGFLPPLAVQLISIGEESGQLEAMLSKVADIFEREIQNRIQRSLSLLTPLLTLGIGFFIAGIIGTVLSALLSVYSLPL
jgi:general secretion pathway protein F